VLIQLPNLGRRLEDELAVLVATGGVHTSTGVLSPERPASAAAAAAGPLSPRSSATIASAAPDTIAPSTPVQVRKLRVCAVLCIHCLRPVCIPVS
jgi:hypothetical protein